MSRARSLGLGTVQWGMPYGIANRNGVPNERESRRMLDRAREHGISELDTARAYGNSEAVLGALAPPGSGFDIVTKLSPHVGGPGVTPREASRRTSASVRASLTALRRDRVDTLLLHRTLHRTDANGAIFETLCKLRDRGVIGRLGVSTGSPEEALACLEDPELSTLQVAANLFDQRLLKLGFFERARTAGKRVYVRSVFLQGVAHVSPADLPDSLALLRAPLEAVHAFARTRGVTVTDVFLAHARERFAGAIVLVGCEMGTQLDENVRSFSSTLPTGPDLVALEASMPDLPEAVLDPSRWSSRD